MVGSVDIVSAGVPLLARLPQAGVHCRSQPHTSLRCRAHPPPPRGRPRAQSGNRWRASLAQVQPCRGCGGRSARFLPMHCFPQLLAAQAAPGRKAGWREVANTATCSLQPGLSKPRFLRPPSATGATVASGRLTMPAGAGALLPGRVTSLNCPHGQTLPTPLQHIWPACLPGGPRNTQLEHDSTILGGSQRPGCTRPGGGGLAGGLLWGLDTA